jgi:hypothetical protein
VADRILSLAFPAATPTRTALLSTKQKPYMAMLKPA